MLVYVCLFLMDLYTVSTHYVYNLQNEFVVHTLILSQILF